jgi:hypothetical protein
MLTIKCQRTEFELTPEDKIMYNGACYQIITRTVGYGWNTSIPIIAKSKAEKLIKEGKIIFSYNDTKMNTDIYKIVE